MTFKSKKDVFFKIIIFSLILFFILIGIKVLNVSNFTNEGIIGLVIITLVLILLLWIFYGTYYEIEKTIFKYTCGPFRGKIEIKDITEITIGKTMWVGTKPATAKNGLIIKYQKFEEIYISPKSNELFLREVLKINPDINLIESKK
jgi:hypothetical protein